MNWIINLSMAILLTSITGTIVFAVWYAIGLVLRRYGYLNVMYHILLTSFLFWLIPISYLVLLVLNKLRWNYPLFSRSPMLYGLCSIFLCGWFIGFCTLAVKYIRDSILVNRRLQTSCLVDGEIYDIFCNICERLNISVENIELGFDYSVASPCIGGLKKQYVILPNLEYTAEQLKVIFLHELTHYRQKNHLIRHLVQLIFMIHFFNPIMWLYKNELGYWGEYTCDYEAIQKTKGVDTYFNTIELIAKTPSIVDFLSSNLYENTVELSKRRKLMERSYEGKIKTKMITPLVVIVMLCTSTLVTQAATVAVADRYCDLYWETAEYIEEDEMVIDSEEYFLESIEPGVIVEDWNESDIMLLDIGSGYSWSINPNTAKLGETVSLNSGKHVTIAVTDNNGSGMSYRMGLKRPDGSIVYVNGSNFTGHDFSLSASGNYHIYVYNAGSRTLSVSVYVSIY